MEAGVQHFHQTVHTVGEVGEVEDGEGGIQIAQDAGVDLGGLEAVHLHAVHAVGVAAQLAGVIDLHVDAAVGALFHQLLEVVEGLDHVVLGVGGIRQLDDVLRLAGSIRSLRRAGVRGRGSGGVSAGIAAGAVIGAAAGCQAEHHNEDE